MRTGMRNPTLKATFRLNQTVAYEYKGGEWTVINKRQLIGEPWRYDLQNKATGQILRGCRDKDIVARTSRFFDAFANQAA